MGRVRWARVAAFGALVFCWSAGILPAWAVPTAVPYVGYLTQTVGGQDQPYNSPEGGVAVEVTLYDAQDGGSALWGPCTKLGVVVTGGILSFVIGAPCDLAEESLPPLDGDIFGPAADVWVDLTIAGTHLMPRQHLLSVPYALAAQVCERAEDALTFGGVGPEQFARIDQSLAGLTCADAGVPKFDSEAGTWNCGSALTAEELAVLAPSAGLLTLADACPTTLGCDVGDSTLLEVVDVLQTQTDQLTETVNGLVEQCASALRCGGILCPTLGTAGQYVVGCNMRDHCEYQPTDSSGWRRWDVWIWVPPGQFMMGSPEDEPGREIWEGPQHLVTMAQGFFVMKYEITAMQYEACRVNGTCIVPSLADGDGEGWGLNTSSDRPTHPQNGITWQQAKNFCAWMAPEARLASEAEWEYAAAGPVHRKYPWGDGPEVDCEHGVYKQGNLVGRPWGCDSCTAPGCSGTQPVGSMPAGASYVGAMDMAGNVWEWCEDCHYQRYNGAPVDGSAWGGPEDCYRVLRSGSFQFVGAYMRSATRGSDTPTSSNVDYGARCVRGLQP